MKTRFAIGCLVQWYEVEIFQEYLTSILTAVKAYNKDLVDIDVLISYNQDLEEVESEDILKTIRSKFNNIIDNVLSSSQVNITFEETTKLTTIADYRREFNRKYCDLVDVLVWGETDMLFPHNGFAILDLVHTSSEHRKYLVTFGICKMWDESWKAVEHVDFTDKPFIENDYDNWWSVKYTMTQEEMNNINNKVSDLDIIATLNYKFNGCGLVISSEVIKQGINIPEAVFFVHEDTAFQEIVRRFNSEIPQYIVRNILVVHNRNHPKKRLYIKGETGDTLNKRRRSNDWYVKANKYSEVNCQKLFDPKFKFYTWKDVWK